MWWSTIIYILLFCIVAIKARKVTSDSACTADINATIHQCVLPVKSYAEILGSTINGISDGRVSLATITTVDGVQMFKELCGKITTFDLCIKDARLRCPKHLLISLIDVSYGYLCSEGYTDFMSNANCLINLDQDPIIRQCHSVAVRKIFSLYNNTKLDVDQRLFQLCGALSVFTFCIENKVKLDCGTLAWSIINKVLKDTTTTLIPTCTFVAPVNTDSLKGLTQLGTVWNKTESNLLNNGSRDDLQKLKTKYSTTMSSAQSSTQVDNNVKGRTAPQTKDSAISILSNRWFLNAICCSIFVIILHYK